MGFRLFPAVREAVPHRLKAPDETRRPVEHIVPARPIRSLRRFAGGREVLLQRFQIAGDHRFELIRVLRRPLRGDPAGVMDLLLQLAVPDAVRGFTHGPRRFRLIPAPVATDLVESLFQSLDALGQLLLLARNTGYGLSGPLLFEILDGGADPVLGGPEPSRLVKRGVDIAPETSAPLSVEVAPRAAQGVRGGQAALEPLATVSPAGGPHVLRRIPQPARDRREVRTGTLASQTLEPPGQIFGFGGQLVLGRAGPAAG